jgi:hypothetical protein
MLIQMTPQQVTDNWPTILHILKPALNSDKRSATDVLMALGSGMMQAYVLSDKAKGILVTSLGFTKGKKPKRGLWVMFAAGEIAGGPKARVETMEEIMLLDVIPMARQRECDEVIVEAPRWWPILKRMGFKMAPRPGGMTLRKAI